MSGCTSEVKNFLLIRKSSDADDPYLVPEIVGPGKVIDYINMTDIYSDFEDYSVHAITDIGKVIPLTYAGWQPGCLIELRDPDGKVVLSGYGEDH